MLVSTSLTRLMAVSYTHLDVYKRQQRYWFKRQLELAAEASLPVIIHSRDAAPVSYTHLDVYKRQRRDFAFRRGTGKEQGKA